jgi:hypothetical protein
MLKLFDNSAALKFGRGNQSVTGMVSSEGEEFAFRCPGGAAARARTGGGEGDCTQL